MVSSKWKTETCSDGIIEGLNNLAKTKEYPERFQTQWTGEF